MNLIKWPQEKARSYSNPFHRLMYWIVFAIIVLFILGIPLAIWTDRSLDFWVSYIKESNENVPFIVSYILTIFTNIFGVGFNLITEVVRLFL